MPAKNAAGGSKASKSLTPPNQTLYVTNLNDKLRKDDLRLSLYTLFGTYGPVLDVIALKTMKMRGQAHIVFRDVHASTQAMRALQGFDFFGKEMRIEYARGKSDTIAKLDGTFRLPTTATAGGTSAQQDGPKSIFDAPPTSSNATSLKPPNGSGEDAESGSRSPQGTKRRRDDENNQEDEPMEEEDDSDVQMEVSSDED